MEILFVLLMIIVVPAIMFAIGASQIVKAMQTISEIKKKR